MIKGYKDGDDITIMNTHYLYPKKDDETGKWDKGTLMLIYKDNRNGQKHVEIIDDPDYEFYLAKENTLDMSYNHLFAEAKDVVRVVAPYSNLEKSIAEMVGMKDWFDDNVKNGNRYENKKIHLHPAVFMSDTDIQDHYRFRFDIHFKNEIVPISKSFFDIEVDGKHMMGDFPEPGECPINAVTLVMQETKQIYVFLLRTKENLEQINRFEEKVKSGEAFFNKLKAFIRETVGGQAKEEKFKLNEFNYNFAFYDEEEEIRLIQDIFAVINAYQPDFTLAWNMAFDVPYIIARIEALGYDPAEIMSHPDFSKKVVRYYIDERNKNEYAERGDFATISSYTTFLDQMIHFASRRKGQAQLPSFKLDDIGNIVAGVRKLDYKHITTDLMELPYLDYETFVMYNIMDPIVQYCIEFMTQDLEYLFAKCINNNTRYQKGHRQTVYLTNRAAKEFFAEGKIIGNNANRYNSRPENKFPGAFVSDPLKIGDKPKMRICGIPVRLFSLLDDFDFKSLYPSIIMENNIAPNTQVGMIVIPEQVHDQENRMKTATFSRGGAFVEDLVSRNWLEIGRRWFGLPDYAQLFRFVRDYFRYTKFNPMVWNYDLTRGMVNMIMQIPDGVKPQMCVFYGENERPNMIDIIRPLNMDHAKEVITNAENYPRQQFERIA